MIIKIMMLRMICREAWVEEVLVAPEYVRRYLPLHKDFLNDNGVTTLVQLKNIISMKRINKRLFQKLKLNEFFRIFCLCGQTTLIVTMLAFP